MRSSAPVSPEFAAAFRALAADGATNETGVNRNGNGTSGGAALTFAQFMELALYHPQLGYYRRDRKRVGYGDGTDFYTASSSGAVFGELVVAACVKLLGDGAESPNQIAAASDYTFIEIGAETEGGVLAGVNHPFAAAKTIRVGEDFSEAISGRCIVFSNELFDAQPIRRFIRRDGAWIECGVTLNSAEELSEVELPPSQGAPESWLPVRGTEGELPDGYRFDAPRAATDLAAKIAAQPWEGLFVAFDYGKSLAELTSMTPNGTARAYFKHTQSNDLLANTGEQDLTAHVCWDWLAEALSANGFNQPTVESQEAFFIGHAGEFLAKTMAAEATRLSQRKLALLQLLHPTHLGQKFQVLWARR